MKRKSKEQNIEKKQGIIVYFEDEIYKELAVALSQKLSVECTNEGEIAKQYELMLCYSKEGLYFTDHELKIMGDFKRLEKRITPNNLSSEFLVKASKIKGIDNANLSAIDATAGLGEDSFILAASGYNVMMFERDTIISALLEDTIERAKKDFSISHIANRMTLIKGDSIDYMNNSKNSPDLVLLDPMFPKRQKSALVKKKFQLLHYLESPCTDEEELLNSAIGINPRRILIKRPLKGEYLAGKKPDYSLSGKAVRYDVINFVR